MRNAIKKTFSGYRPNFMIIAFAWLAVWFGFPSNRIDFSVMTVVIILLLIGLMVSDIRVKLTKDDNDGNDLT